jgi:hypothetical protein
MTKVFMLMCGALLPALLAGELTYGIISDITASQSVHRIPIDVSPQCQQNALQIIETTAFGGALGEHYCHRLSHGHQQLLALELTKCHLADVGQSAFKRSCDEKEDCISLLNDRGFHSYTTFKVHVEQYCLKLNHDMMIYRQQELGAELQQSAQRAAVQFTELIHQQGEIKEEYSSLFITLTEQQSELHDNLLQQALRRQEQLDDQALQRQELQEHQLDDWMQGLMSGQAHEMQLQRKELQDLSTAVGTTASQLKPLLGMDQALEYISNGVHIGSLLFYLYLSLNVIWLLTLPSWVRACRHKLFGMAMLELALKVFILVQAEEPAQGEWLQLAGFACRALQVGTYLSSMVRYCFTGEQQSPDQQQRELTQTVISVKETVEWLQRQSEEREERLIQLVREQRREMDAVAFEAERRNNQLEAERRNNQFLYRPPLERVVKHSDNLMTDPLLQETAHYTTPRAMLNPYDAFEQQRDAASQQADEKPIIFYDAVMVTPSPLRDVGDNIAESEKRPRSDSDGSEERSEKRQRVEPAHE